MSTSRIEPWVREILVCPACKGPLTDGTSGAESQSLDCAACSLAYPVEGGVPVLLADHAIALG